MTIYIARPLDKKSVFSHIENYQPITAILKFYLEAYGHYWNDFNESMGSPIVNDNVALELMDAAINNDKKTMGDNQDVMAGGAWLNYGPSSSSAVPENEIWLPFNESWRERLLQDGEVICFQK